MNIRSVLILGIASITLSGCSGIDELISFAKDWAKDKDIISDNGMPTGKTVSRVVFGSSTGDSKVDAVIDAGYMLRGIKQAEDEARNANAALQGDAYNPNAAIGHLSQAIDMRPKDWHYRNQRGALLIEQGDPDAAKEDFIKAEEHCNNAKGCLQALHRGRSAALNESLQRQFDRSDADPKCATYRSLSASQLQLAVLAEDPKAKKRYRDTAEEYDIKASLGECL